MSKLAVGQTTQTFNMVLGIISTINCGFGICFWRLRG